MRSGAGLDVGASTVRWGAIASVLVSFVMTACGLLFSPGDYTDSSGRAEPARSEPDAATASDGGEPASSTRIVLVAGQRDPLPDESATLAHVAETFHTTVSDAGELGPWTWDVSPPVARAWIRAEVFGGALWLQQASTVYRADFDERITGAWTELALQGGSAESLQRGWLGDAGLLSAGGFVQSTPSTNVYRAAFTDGGLGPWEAVDGSSLVAARGDVTLLRHASFLYALGGRTATSSTAAGSADVEVATIGAGGLPGPFVATETLMNGASSHGVIVPSVASGAGHLVVIGGRTTAQSASLTDVALAAKIDEATGMLGKWTTLPKLPRPVASAAVVVAASTIFVFGGTTPSGASDAVMALPIRPDGTFGAEWRRVATLPGPRASLVGVVY